MNKCLTFLPALFLLFVAVKICVWDNGANAQFLLNDKGQVFTDEPFFNPSIIRENKIKSINGRYSYKPPGKPMRETNYWRIYEFDTLGRIVRAYETKADDGSADTVFFNYVYNGKGQLIYKGIGNEKTFYYTSYFFNQDGILESTELYLQNKNYAGDLTTTLMKKESYEYKKQGNDSVKITLNSYNLPYMKELREFNSMGQLVTIDERFITNNEGTIQTFSYYPSGALEEKSLQDTREPKKKETLQFKYDKSGNILEKKVLNYGELKYEVQFIFNESTGLLSAILEQRNQSNFISILRIKEYEYFSEILNTEE